MVCPQCVIYGSANVAHAGEYCYLCRCDVAERGGLMCNDKVYWTTGNTHD